MHRAVLGPSSAHTRLPEQPRAAGQQLVADRGESPAPQLTSPRILTSCSSSNLCICRVGRKNLDVQFNKQVSCYQAHLIAEVSSALQGSCYVYISTFKLDVEQIKVDETCHSNRFITFRLLVNDHYRLSMLKYFVTFKMIQKEILEKRRKMKLVLVFLHKTT